MNELVPVYHALRALIKRYEPPFTATIDLDSRYELWSKKPVVIAGRKHKDVFFASAVIQRHYVGFYFMPVYTDVDLKEVFAPELLRLLKGKSCFHIKVLTPELTRHVEAALEAGFKRYQENGWV